MCETELNNLVKGTEIDISYGFEVDSKGAVKPKFSASIHKLVSDDALVATSLGDSLVILTGLAQEALDKTPKVG